MAKWKKQEKDLVFALDIGTRSIVGIVGKPVEGKFKLLAVESAEHKNRVMMDGQIDDIDAVAALAKQVTGKLEARLGVHLNRVCVAAAGRALRTERGSFSLELEEKQAITENLVGQLEAGAITAAEEQLRQREQEHRQFFLVGYSVAQYRLDDYPLAMLLHHNGKKAEVDVVATFLPGEVVESLYSAMFGAGLQVASMTLEPIAAMNAAIPGDIRLLNLALVDIGAGTSDIAVCREGSVTGYTMATVAGDEITEAIMRYFLVDFQMAEQMKRSLGEKEEIPFTNILGLDETTTAQEVEEAVAEAMDTLAQEIARQVTEVNGGKAPSAVFLAGGGSKLQGLCGKVAQYLQMDEKRVAIAGANFAKSVVSPELEINTPEFATPLGIAISAGLGLLNDSYVILLNGTPAKLFRSGVLSLQDILMMNGYLYSDMIGKSGRNLSLTLDGKRVIIHGEPALPAVLRVNGEDASIHSVVHAGDKIDFIPAKSGRPAARTLLQLLGEDFPGGALVNNEEVPWDTPLAQGDVILTLPQSSFPKPPVQEVLEVSEPADQGPDEAQDRVKTPGGAKGTRGAKRSEPVPAQELAPAGQTAEKKPEDPVPENTPPYRPLHLFLNDEAMDLPGKLDGSPYYLMDLLEYSQIDFQNLDRPVELLVNGQEAGFQQVLRENDSVIIRCL